MKTKMMSAAAIVAVAGQAMAQPVIDGARDDGFYGTTPIWVNNQPTTRGDNATLACDPCQVGNPGAVQTGIELAIPLAALGNPNIADIKITAWVNGGGNDFLSNQVLGGLPCPSDNLGEPRTLNFASLAGNQFITGVPTTTAVPTINGTRVGDTLAYLTAQATQTNRTGFGNSSAGLPGQANGSETNRIYATVNTTNNTLYILITGNLETNGNKFDLFIDSLPAVGQNQLRNDNPSIGLNNDLNRMGADPVDPVARPGLRFDTGFAADYYVRVNNTFDSGTNTYSFFADYARLSNVASPGDPGVGFFLGTSSTPANAGGTLTGGNVTPGDPAEGIRATLDNSNIAGVDGTCPASGGNPDVANGSELNSAYGRIFNGRLYLLVTGNLANNFDKLQLFFDAEAGGQNRIRSNNVDVDFNALNRMGEGPQGPGLLFDTGFSPDYWLNFGNGNGSTPATIQFFANGSTMRTDGARVDGLGNPIDYGAFDGGTKSQAASGRLVWPTIPPQTGPRGDQPGNGAIFTNHGPRTAGFPFLLDPNSPPTALPDLVPGLIRMAINNSNLGGVQAAPPTGGGGTGDAANVTTGMELEIALSELTDCGRGTNPPCASITSLRVAGFISYGESSAGTLSNQVIGGLPNSPSQQFANELGEARLVDFTAQAGNQFITITTGAGGCYPNCDGSTGTPLLTPADFVCFLNRFRAGDSYANCDGSTGTPTLTPADFVCFLNRFRAGC